VVDIFNQFTYMGGCAILELLKKLDLFFLKGTKIVSGLCFHF
jgi:hypothetical protein